MMMTTRPAMIAMTLGSRQWEYRTQVRHGSDPNTMAGLGGGSVLHFSMCITIITISIQIYIIGKVFVL